LTPRQLRWADYLSCFNFEVHHVEGITNKVVDALSRYYTEFREKDVPPHQYVNIDARIDPEMETLPLDRKIELETALHTAATRRSTRLQGNREPRQAEANKVKGGGATSNTGSETLNDVETLDSTTEGIPLQTSVEQRFNIIPIIKEGYKTDSTFKKVLENPKSHRRFGVQDGIIWTKNNLHRDVMCIPYMAMKNGRRLIELIIDHAHNIMGHFGHFKTSQYVRRTYWWPSMMADIETFCRSCGMCQTTKDSPQRPSGLLHTLPIPDRPWQSVGMDFMGPLPVSKGYDYLMVVIDRLTSMVRLTPTTVKVTVSQVAWLYINEVIKLHGLPESIVSDRDSKFTSLFWREIHRVLGTKFLMSTSFHPQTDGATERANRSIGQILRSVVDNNKRNWAEKCPMVEFAINSSISATTGFAPFELNHGFIPVMGITEKEHAKYQGVKMFA
jgi:hypothetical protein